MKARLFVYSIFLLTFHFIPLSVALIAYDRRNQLLKSDNPNDLVVITPSIDNYRPKLNVKFINFQSVKRRKATRIDDGRIRIETSNVMVEKVKVDDNFVQLRFGGAPRIHYPYNRVVIPETGDPTTEPPKSTDEPTIATTPKSFATTSTVAPNYSAQPALYLPSRFHRNREDVVIVFHKKTKD